MKVLATVTTTWPPAAPRAEPTTLPANSKEATCLTAFFKDGVSPLIASTARLVPTVTAVVIATFFTEKLFFKEVFALATPSFKPELSLSTKDTFAPEAFA